MSEAEAASPYSSFGRWLRQRRKARDLTQRDLADLVGCSPETIRKIEAGRRMPSRYMAELLAQRLEVLPEKRPALIRLARFGSPAREAPGQESAVAGRTPDASSLVRERSAVSSPPTNLPAGRTSFVGREKEQSRIGELLRQEHVRLLTLTGAPGIGKTRLSLQVAASWLDPLI